MHTWIQSLRFVVRSLRRSPAFAVMVILTLSVGIGLNTAMFTVVDSVLLRPLGYRDADRIMALRTHFHEKNYSIASLGGDDYRDLAEQIRSFESTAYYGNFMDGVEMDGKALFLPVAYASPRFGEVLGVEPVTGRLFRPGDSDGHEVLLSEALAREHFGSPRAALGHTVRYGGLLRTIVGVLPAGFSFPGKTSVWFEAPARPENGNRTAYNQHAIGKLREGVTPDDLGAELALFSRHLAAVFPEDQDKRLEAVPLRDEIVGTVRPTLRLLMGSVVVLLLIVCANITHLQLVRSTRQVHNISIRTALGAPRRLLVVRALLEAAILALLGGLGAVLLALPVLRILARVAPASLPRLNEVHLNLDVLVFSVLVSLILMSCTAILPVWRSWHVDPAFALRQDTSRGTESRGTLRVRNGFLIVQVALTLTLSVAAILLMRQLREQSRQDLGFAPDHLLILDSHFLEHTAPAQEPPHPTAAQSAAFKLTRDATLARRAASLDSAMQTLATVPGVISVAAVRGAPMGFDGPDVSYAVKGKQVFAPPFHNLPIAEIRPITPDFLSTMRIPVRRGRGFTPQDRLGSPWVVLIDEATARQSFPGEDPIGRQILCGLSDSENWMSVVGVVGSVHLSSPGAAPQPMMYVPVAQYPWAASDTQLMVRTQVDPALMMRTLQDRLARTHPEVAVKASTMIENIQETQRGDRFRNLLFSSFAAVSLLLAALGIYGVTAYSVAQRSFEFGLRFALGADHSQVFALVLNNTLITAALGVVIGVGLSLSLTHVLGSIVGQLPAFDGVAYATASAAVLSLAAVAALLPASRAARVDPMRMLRTE